MRLSNLKKINKNQFAWGALIVFVLMQFIRIDKTNPESNPKMDLINMTNPSEDISFMLKVSCYDCHSHHTKYPWYTNIAPLSWWIKGHINGGRKHLNFSLWGAYDQSQKDHKLEECAEMLEHEFMPLTSYTLGHKEAKLSPAERKKLMEWFDSLRL